MKLRNKKTGEIKECVVIPIDDNGYPNEYQVFDKGDSLAELNEEWEDYKEPKEYWYIYADKPQRADCGDILEEDFKAIGNYFSSKEEAEKAIEKLKAWKRLKDKGFSIYSWDYEFDMVDKPAQTIILRASAVDSSNEDLDLLFGGEE